ncbi:MAG: hypothetical protein QNK11_06875 [Legionella sp.]|nr:hypothetical protein [Legionella sp.]
MKYILFCLIFIVSMNAAAMDLPKGRGALLYDAISKTGPAGPKPKDPGHWIPNIKAFNAEVTTGKKISCLYPYAGDVEMYCTNPSNCVYSGPKKNVFVYYNAGLASIKAYHDAFPTAKMLPIIDGVIKGSLLKALQYPEIGTKTAALVAGQVCKNPSIDGIFFDLEPFDISMPGQFSFYKEILKQFKSEICIDTKHPDGRSFGMFLHPHKVTDWDKMSEVLGDIGFVAVSAYDIQDSMPPVPTPMKQYKAGVRNMLEIMDAKSQIYKIAYRVVLPWASSFGEFNQYGLYDPSNPPSDFKLIKDYTSEGLTQVAYVKAAHEIMKAVCKSPYYLGMDGWSWTQYKSPKPKEGQLLLPVIPEGEVVEYLQKN